MLSYIHLLVKKSLSCTQNTYITEHEVLLHVTVKLVFQLLLGNGFVLPKMEELKQAKKEERST